MYVVEAPDIAPARGGLLTVANVIEMTDGGFGHQGVDYQAMLCGPVGDVPTDGSEKEFERVPVVEGKPFAIYRGVEGSMFERGQGMDRVQGAFSAGESFGVERALQRTVLNPRAEDVTPTAGTAVSPKVAVGLLEQHAGESYGGLPLLHVSRFGAVFLPLEVDEESWAAHTKQGTPVANGAGYGSVGPGGTEAGDGEFWLYATGQVNLFRGEVQSVAADDYRYNIHRALVERVYVPTVECFVAAVLVRGD